MSASIIQVASHDIEGETKWSRTNDKDRRLETWKQNTNLENEDPFVC